MDAGQNRDHSESKMLVSPGVPQESAIGPTLFVGFFNSLSHADSTNHNNNNNNAFIYQHMESVLFYSRHTQNVIS